MKTNFPLVIVLMLAFSICSAQSTELSDVIESSKAISVSAHSEDVKVSNEQKNEPVLIDASKLKSTISRTNSDIRIYLYRKRNVGNISFVFPKINKAVRA
ncbi:hypothetical protein [uncultured Algibacter sp.]|uniref:hypothetical protein n=1 Tax=uncultured Algibacter sp. TaxID=298659 RepID=UPI00260FDB43|nr:hypothetical protein [uncultured Algibacter sp.]